MDEKKELTEEDKAFIKENWSKMPLLEITRLVSGNPDADGRHFLGKSIKEFIVKECGGTPQITKAKRKEAVILTDEQRKLIENNFDKTNTTLELARLVFPNIPNLTNLHKEYAVVQEYIKEIDPEHKFEGGTIATKDYAPPQSINRLIPKVNKAIIRFQQGSTKPMKEEALNEFEKKCLNTLLGYLNVPRFVMQINNYIQEEERELFETNFIRYTFDKPDLLQEEVDQYIVLCDEIVSQQSIIRLATALSQQVKDYMDMPPDSSGRKPRIPETLVEMVHKNQQKLNDSRNRVESLIKALTGDRAKRLDKKHTENASILNLVQAWQDEKSRLELIELAEKQKMAEGDEVDKLSSMDAVIARIAGISKERARH